MPVERGIAMDLSEVASRYAQEMNFKPGTMETAALKSFAEYGKQPNIMTDKDWHELLRSVRSGNVVYYARIKHVYVEFLKWLMAQGVECKDSYKALRGVDTGLTSMAFEADVYFRDFADFVDKFNSVGLNSSGEYGIWHTLIACFTLLWFGISIEDALALRKDDLFYSEDNGYLVHLTASDEYLKIRNPIAVRILKSYLDSEGYISDSSRVRSVKYADVPQVLRTGKGAFKRNALSVSVTAFNKQVQESGQSWRLSLIYFPENASFLWTLRFCQQRGIPLGKKPLFRYRVFYCHCFGIPDPINDPEHYSHMALGVKYSRFVLWLQTYYPEVLQSP